MQIHDDEGVSYGPVSGVDAKGNPAPVQGVAATSADPTKVSVVAQPDGLSFNALAVGPLATGVVITITGNDASGNPLPPFTDTIDVIPEGATAMNVPVGAPFKQ